MGVFLALLYASILIEIVFWTCISRQLDRLITPFIYSIKNFLISSFKACTSGIDFGDLREHL